MSIMKGYFMNKSTVKGSNYMKMRSFIIFFLIYFSCSVFQGTSYKDPDEDGSLEWGSKEVKSTVETISNSLEKFFFNSNNKPYIEFLRISNKSSEHIDTNILENELRIKLKEKKITIIDKSYRKETFKEIELEMKGMIDEKSKITAGKILSANFQLKGEISDQVKIENGIKKQLLIITFILLNYETNSIDWQDSKKFYKVSNISGLGL